MRGGDNSHVHFYSHFNNTTLFVRPSSLRIYTYSSDSNTDLYFYLSTMDVLSQFMRGRGAGEEKVDVNTTENTEVKTI